MRIDRRVAIAAMGAALCLPAHSQRLQPFYELSLVTLDGKRTIIGLLPDGKRFLMLFPYGFRS
jgi:hypothetical protein